MAVSRNGHYGFSGKVGNSVTYLLNGQWVQRSIGKTTRPPSLLQLANRQRTKVSNVFLSPIKDFINVGFKSKALAERKNAHNMASSYNRINAIVGHYPHQYIDYSRVLLSEGRMSLPRGVAAKLIPGGLEFSWQVNPDVNGQRWNDQTMLMAYLPEVQDAIFIINGARRNEGKDFLKLSMSEGPVIIETYLSFISADHKSVCNSLYTGQFLWTGA